MDKYIYIYMISKSSTNISRLRIMFMIINDISLDIY